MKFDDLHPRLNGFDEIYQSSIKGELKKAATKRHNNVQDFMRECKIKIAVAGALSILLVGFRFIDAALITILLTSFILIHKYVINTDSTHNLNPLILSKLCKCFGLEYSERVNSIIFDEMMSLQLLGPYTKRRISDCINGFIGGVYIDAFKLNLENKEKDSDGKEQTIEVFNGLCLKVNFHKKLTGRTYIYVRFDLTSLKRRKFPMGCLPVDLEYPDFERFYDAYTTDQIEARYILTPRFIERIWSFHNLIGGESFIMAFDSNGIYILLSGLEPYLTGAYYKMTDPQFIETYIKNIALLFDIVEKLELDLKTKI